MTKTIDDDMATLAAFEEVSEEERGTQKTNRARRPLALFAPRA